MRLMLLRCSALLLALTALTACSTPQTSSTASTSEAEAPAPTPEPITKLKAVALSDALPYSSQNEQEWEGLAHEVLGVIQAELGGDAAPEIIDVTSIKAAGEALKDGSANIACGTKLAGIARISERVTEAMNLDAINAILIQQKWRLAQYLDERIQRGHSGHHGLNN